MLVVLDANVLIRDFGLAGNAFQLLLGQGSRLGMTIAVPESALREATRQYRRQLDAAQGKFRSTESELSRLAVEIEDPFRETLEQAGSVISRTRRYEEKLRKEFTQSGRTILPLPSLSHDQALGWMDANAVPARHALSYGDLLIWESVVAAASPADRTVLVSADEDFRDPDSEELAGELVADAARRVPEASVVLAPGLAKFVGRFLAPKLPSHEDFWAKFDESLAYEIEERLAHEIVMFGLPDETIVTPIGTSARQAWIIGVEDMSDVMVENARGTPDGKVFFDVAADVRARIEYVADPSPGAETPRREQAIPPFPPHLLHGQASCHIDVEAEGSYALGTSRLTGIRVLKARSSE